MVQGFSLGTTCGMGMGNGTFQQMSYVRLAYAPSGTSLPQIQPSIRLTVWGVK